MDNRKTTYDRRRMIRRRVDRLIFKKDFESISDSAAALRKTLKEFQENGAKKEEAKIFEPIIENMEKQIHNLDKKLFNLHAYWISSSE
jgi:hypothetical protein